MRITDGATPGSAPGSAPLEDVAGGADAQPPAVPPAAPRFVERSVETRLPTKHGVFRALGYREHGTGQEHLALVLGRVEGVRPPLVRVHSECLTGDVLGSQRCDCGPQLDLALRAVAREGAGVVVYLRGHEGRGIGLVDKLRAYALQDDGADTVDANLVLGLPVDARDYAAAAGVLLDLQVPEVRLLTNNPAKVEGLRAGGVEVVGTVPLRTDPTPANLRYLRTKRQRCGHDLGPLEEAGSVLRGL